MRFTRDLSLTLKKAGRELVVVLAIVLTFVVLLGGVMLNHVMAAGMGQQIADKAKELAWSYGTSESYYRTRPTDAFVQATERANTPNNNDCLSFVKTVVIDSGADTGFPSGDGPQETDLVEYMGSSDKWEQINTTNISDLQPGDILVSADTVNHRNHIFVYIGDNKAAGANLDSWYGRIGDLANEWDLEPEGVTPSGTPFYYSGNQYKVFRSSGSSTSTSTSGTSRSLNVQKSQLPGGVLEEFAQNDILFYDPSDCIDPNSTTGICGNTAEEKIWTILRQTFDPVHAAAIFGSIAREGGFQPVKWEYGNVVNTSTCEFAAGMTWEDLYSGKYDGKYGVGSFGLTSGLSDYLHYINDHEPELLGYFKDPSNTCLATGDELAKKIGEDATNRLIEIEVNYFINEWLDKDRLERFQSITNLNEAATYWAHNIEVCAACGYNAGDSELSARAIESQKFYDEYKDYSCDVSADSCSKLAELRTAMWTAASQEDRENFMYVVAREDYSIAGVEGFMNQVISKHNDTNGVLGDWLDGQCYEFGGGMSCRGSHTITSEDQDMINEALNGSNHIKFAMGNATGGSSVGAGKIVCVWDGTKCRDDVDYSAQDGNGPCSLYSPSEDFGECWGLEGDDSWADSMAQECGTTGGSTSTTSSASSASSTSSTSPTAGASTSSSGTVSGSDITWIGDSDSALAMDENGNGLVEKTFPGVDYGPSFNDSTSYIQSCKGISSSCTSNNPSGLEILRKIVREGKLRKYLVFALGGNDGWTQDSMNTFLSLVGNDTQVILTTTKYRNADYTENNELVRKTADEHDNVYVADVAANYKDEYMDSSGIEFTSEGAKMFIQTIKEALEAAGGPCATGVEWNNGWLVEGSMEGVVIEDVTTGNVQLSESQVNPIGSYTTPGGKPNKILLHNTDGPTGGLAAYPSNNMYPAHFTIDLKKRTVSQHFSIYQPSMAVGGYNGFSNDKAGPIQFEIVGYIMEDPGYTPEYDLFNYSDEDWDYLAKVMVAIHEETGIPLTSSVDWAHGNNELSTEEFMNYEGVLGHMHTPGNEKIDPGDIWKFVSEAIKRQSCDDSCTTYEGEYPEYLQWDERWGDIPYGGGTISSSACGLVSMAMLTTVATGQDVFPDELNRFLEEQFALGKIPGAETPYYNSTSVSTLDPVVGEHYGFEVITDTASTVEETKTKFRQYLQDGYMIHFTGAGCYPGFQSDGACSAGHVIGLYSIDGNDIVMQANPAWGGNQEASLDDMANARLWDDFTAIKGTGGRGVKNTCDSNVCSTNLGQAQNVSIGSNGLTEAEAQKIADYYNSNDVTASNFIDGIIPSSCEKINCVSFSYWFVSAFTDASEKGVTSAIIGDGSYIADTGLPGVGWQNGNDPKPFSVFGGAGSSAWSHTGVVVGTTSDGDYITIEAAYCQSGAQVLTRPSSYFAQGVGILAYPGEHFTPDKGHLGNKSLYEIIGN